MDLTKTYYVYEHRDPKTGELMYVGHGYGSRAWHLGSYRREGNSDPTRSQTHKEWAYSLFSEGYLPSDLVVILEKGLTKEEACKKEQEQIRFNSPLFNKALGEKLVKLDGDEWILAQMYKNFGLSYKKIAKLFEVSTMTIYRGLTGATKNVG